MSPLSGRTILVTRAREQAGALTEALAGLGAEVVEAPAIGFADPQSWGPVDAAIARLGSYDWLLFTSVNAVERFLSRAERAGGGPMPLVRASAGGTRVAAIGAATAGALRVRGIQVAGVPSVSRAEGLFSMLAEAGPLAGARVLIPRAEVAREVLPESLRERGAAVDVVPVYRTVAAPVAEAILEKLRSRQIDMVVLTSGSAIGALLAGIGGTRLLSGVAVAVIGEVTAEAARAKGLQPSVIAPRAAIGDLVAAVETFYKSKED
ncbi:MAG TPA: uroporphyrinogen-III synthase [Candidatus Polarisedimenticolia bacterium]|nr:uroporphyrinogen-III synthase [Candidatus Polarisedimenticolia bacterium]